MLSFGRDRFLIIDEALHIAENVTAEHYKFSSTQWKRHSYEVKTWNDLKEDEVSRYAFALLNKGFRVIEGHESRTRMRDFYYICLQDPHILRALKRDGRLDLLALLVYVFTHELVHIVRFCNYSQRFEVGGEHREKEEQTVHDETYNILRRLPLKNVDYVLDAYEHHRTCEVAFGI